MEFSQNNNIFEYSNHNIENLDNEEVILKY